MIPGRFAPPHDHADGSCQWGWQGLLAHLEKTARCNRGHDAKRICIRSTKRNWGGYADAFSFCSHSKEERGVQEAEISCAQAAMADTGRGSARRGGRIRRRQLSRRRQRFGGDAAAAHLLRAAHAKDVRDLFRRRMGRGQHAEDPRCAGGVRREEHVFRRGQLGGSVSRAGQGYRRERLRADEPLQRSRPLQFPYGR